MRMTITEITQKTKLFKHDAYGLLDVAHIGDKVHFVVHCGYATKLQCDNTSRFGVMVDDAGNQYIEFETSVAKHKLYPVVITNIKLVD